jgi:hypothetical protein
VSAREKEENLAYSAQYKNALPGIDALNQLYGGAINQKSAAENNQRGMDLYDSIERAMSEGIAKGFVKSTEEIAGNMQMMYKLSGNNPLWQGAQGAQRLSQMNAAFANSTNLESVGDVINYSVVRDILNDGDRQSNFYRMMNLDHKKEYEAELYTGTYLDEMIIMGRGVNGEILKGQYEYLKNKEGSNEAAIVEHLKNMNGLNDMGGVQLLRLMQRGESIGWESKEFEEQRKRITEGVDYKSDSAKYQDMINALSNTSAKIGQIEFDNTEFKLLRESAVRLESILQERIEKYSGTPMPPSYPLPGISEDVLREHANISLSVSHSMIFNDAAIKPGTTGLDAYNQIKERYFNITRGYDETKLSSDFLSTAPAMGLLAETIPRMIADGDFSTTGRNNDFEAANSLLNTLERNIATLNENLQVLTNRAETLQRDGIPLTGNILLDDL